MCVVQCTAANQQCTVTHHELRAVLYTLNGSAPQSTVLYTLMAVHRSPLCCTHLCRQCTAVHWQRHVLPHHVVVSSEKDSEGSFGETGGHKKKEQRCDQGLATSSWWSWKRQRCDRKQPVLFALPL
jgi:hypothetical protein